VKPRFRLSALGLALLVLGLSPLLPGATWARTWHVQQDGAGDSRTVQGGINLATSGDTVWVHPGRYVENVRFNGRSISLLSTDGAEATILDGSGQSESVVRIIDGEGPTTVLEGFTITGGGGPSVDGAGVNLFGSEPRIRGNIIKGNTADSGGGGLYCIGSSIEGRWSPQIEDNLFVGNQAGTLGGAILVQGNATPIIVGNTISQNTVVQGDGGGIAVFARLDGIVIRENWIEGNVAGDHGGGIEVIGRGGSPDFPLDIEITKNVILENTARASEFTGESGGGMELSGTDAWVHHNTIVGNTGFALAGTFGGAIVVFYDSSPVIELNIIAHTVSGGGIYCLSGTQPTIRNNLAWDNAGGEGWGACSNWWHENGNVYADPLLCDWKSGVYTVAENSPALTNPAGPMGAFDSPGCAQVSVMPTTWGRVKALYR
jgi:predicted outer membrane repeat protein